MSEAFRYFLIEGGPVLAMASALREQRDGANTAAWEWARRHGAHGVATDAGGIPEMSRPENVVGVSRLGPQADNASWRKLRGYYAPKAGAAALRAEMNALPCFPDMSALNVAIGWEGVPAPGYRFQGPLAQLIWEGDALCIAIPTYSLFGGVTVESARRAVEFATPEGCREISAAEWSLIGAQWAVEREKRQKAAAAVDEAPAIKVA